jgi:hypothetical protein
MMAELMAQGSKISSVDSVTDKFDALEAFAVGLRGHISARCGRS